MTDAQGSLDESMSAVASVRRTAEEIGANMDSARADLADDLAQEMVVETVDSDVSSESFDGPTDEEDAGSETEDVFSLQSSPNASSDEEAEDELDIGLAIGKTPKKSNKWHSKSCGLPILLAVALPLLSISFPPKFLFSDALLGLPH